MQRQRSSTVRPHSVFIRCGEIGHKKSPQKRKEQTSKWRIANCGFVRWRPVKALMTSKILASLYSWQTSARFFARPAVCKWSSRDFRFGGSRIHCLSGNIVHVFADYDTDPKFSRYLFLLHEGLENGNIAGVTFSWTYILVYLVVFPVLFT